MPNVTIVCRNRMGATKPLPAAKLARVGQNNCPDGCGPLQESAVKGMLECPACGVMIWKSDPFEKPYKS